MQLKLHKNVLQHNYDIFITKFDRIIFLGKNSKLYLIQTFNLIKNLFQLLILFRIGF